MVAPVTPLAVNVTTLNPAVAFTDTVDVIVPFINQYVESRKGFVSNKLTNE